ncbi:MAG: hypothetical protein QHH06_10225 [Clostridiales bacterium]|nr:hypothetical protein [Eubacteriales bacterium]MDH7566841.1 hypothetical protein [Clostridiales bacterium]
MTQNEINEAYKLFNIPVDKIPPYNDADEFSKRYQKCSILKDVNTNYSTTSSQLHIQTFEK